MTKFASYETAEIQHLRRLVVDRLDGHTTAKAHRHLMANLAEMDAELAKRN